MPTTNQNQSSKSTKQNRTPGVQTPKGSRDEAKKTQEARAKDEDKERSDWEGMTPKPEQGEDDVAAPGELPETD